MAPSRLGRYEILKLLGQGGMGAVYKASDPLLDRIVALKTINPGLLAGEERDEYLERFRREARAAGRLSHPNIVSVFDLGFDEPTATSFIVMEYVPGVSLETVLVENPALPLDQAIEIVEQVGAALEEAHRHGIVHRDIKPANVFLDERGRVKVGDFGVARLAGSELTQSGIGIGTPGYAAPEVLRGGVADARSDVFALGVLAYRVLTGRRPFDGVTREMLGMEILEREPSPPRAVRAEIPEPLSTAVMRALVKSPEARTPSAQEFLREWRSPVTVPMPTRTVRPERAGSRSRRWILLAATVTAILALGTGAVLAVRALRETATPQEAAAPVAPRRSPAPAPTPRPAAGAGDTSDPAAKAAEELLREGRKRAEEWAREQLKQEEEKKQQGKKDKGRGRDKKKN